MNKKIQFLSAVSVIFLIMFVFAIAMNLKGILVPTFKSEFDVNSSHIGIFLTLNSVAYLCTTYFSGNVIQEHGFKKVIFLGLSGSILSLGVVYFSTNYAILCLGYALLSVASAPVVLSMNSMIPSFKTQYTALLMNLLHFMFGVGGTMIQRVSGVILDAGISWRLIILGVATGYLLTLGLILFVKLPKSEAKETQAHHQLSFRQAIKNPLVIFFVGALGFYVSAEAQLMNWFINYMKQAYQMVTIEATYYSSIFFALFTAGRLVGGLVVQKLKPMKTLFISIGLAAILFVSGIFLKQTGLILISLSGLFFSIVYPTIMVVVLETFERNQTYLMGLIVTASMIISTIVSLLMGVLNDIIGVYYTFFLLPACLVISFVCLGFVKKQSLS